MKKIVMFAVGLALALTSPVFAQSPEDLAKETEEAAKATASQKSTPEQIIAKVNQAAELLVKEGKAALPKFRGKNSEFVFSGTYMSIHELNTGKVILNPTKPKMEGQEMLNLKDADGKAIFVEMGEAAKKGGGWVAYKWPQPGTGGPQLKVTYARLVKVGGEDWVLKCGLYGMSEAEINKLVGK